MSYFNVTFVGMFKRSASWKLPNMNNILYNTTLKYEGLNTSKYFKLILGFLFSELSFQSLMKTTWQ